MRNSEKWQLTEITLQFVWKELSVGTASWQTALIWCRRGAQEKHSLRHLAPMPGRMHMLLGGPAAMKNQVLRLHWQCWLSAQKWSPAQFLDRLQRKLLTDLSSKGSKFYVHTNLKCWKHGKERRMGEKVLMLPSNRLLIGIGQKKPLWPVLEDKLMKTLCIYISPHIFFLPFFFSFIFSGELEWEIPLFHMGSKHPLVLFWP